MSRRVVDALKRSRERHRFLRGMVSWVGFNQTGVYYDRDERYSGGTKYPLAKMLRFAIDGITSFSDVPLRFVSYFGFVSSLVAFVYAAVVVGYKVFSLNPPGYTPRLGLDDRSGALSRRRPTHRAWNTRRVHRTRSTTRSKAGRSIS